MSPARHRILKEPREEHQAAVVLAARRFIRSALACPTPLGYASIIHILRACQPRESNLF